jgi:transposase-like protein
VRPAPQRLTAGACVLHLIRNTFRYASKADWEKLAKDLRPVYTAVNPGQAALRFEEFAETWGGKYPAIITLWRKAWEELIPFLDYDVEIRRVICSTNAIESLNARYRRAVRARGHFPTERAVKCLYLLTPARSTPPGAAGHGGSPDASRAQRVRDHLRRQTVPEQHPLTDVTDAGHWKKLCATRGSWSTPQ